MTTNLKEGERLDDLQIKGYELIQHPGRFCFGMDSSLLSSFVTVKKGERVLLLGRKNRHFELILIFHRKQAFYGKRRRHKRPEAFHRSK